jgi:hypothetical protein
MMTYPTEWTTENPDVWGAEAKCWESAVFDAAGNQVGKVVKGIERTYRGSGIKVFGLVVKYRQFKKFTPPAPKKPEEKEYRSVRTETYNKEGDLSDLTVETRMVYTNSKGEFIKTRSEGNPRITYVKDDGTRVIVKKPMPQKFRDWATKEIITRYPTRAVTPEEWEESK